MKNEINDYCPKVSIVLPTYNGEKYLAESIESVIGQIFTDWELIIVDDCSMDCSGQIAEKYAEKDKRIRVIHNDSNKKLPESLNIGFREAKGEYYTWTSDDNLFLSHAIEAMSNFLDYKLEYGMVCAKEIYIDSEKRFMFELHDYDELSMYTWNMVGACFMYRRSVADKVGEYDKKRFCVEDYDYWIRILESGEKIGYLNGCYYLYRYHNQTLTVQKEELVTQARRQLYYTHLEWIASGISDNKEKLLSLYHEISRDKIIERDTLKKRFIPYLKEIGRNENYSDDKHYIIYGAGKVGREIRNKIREQAVLFADMDSSKWGNEIAGLSVISPDEMKRRLQMDEELGVMISVGIERQLEVIKMLVELGINRYTFCEQINE